MVSVKHFLSFSVLSLMVFQASANNWAEYEVKPLSQSELKESEKQKFDVNDVSLLWDGELDNEEYLKVTDLIPLKKDAKPGSVSEEVFLKVNEFLNMDKRPEVLNPFTKEMEAVDGPTDTFVDFNGGSNLRYLTIRAVRFDDSAPKPGESGHTTINPIVEVYPDGKDKPGKHHIAKGTKFPSLPQMRLVAQIDNSDVAVHLIYTFSKNPENFFSGKKEGDHELFKKVIRDLQILKQKGPKVDGKPATDGAPLGIHPGLAKKGSSFSQELKAMIKYYAKPEYLTNVAILSTNDFDGGSDWVFTAFDIDQKNPNELHLKPLINLKQNFSDRQGPLSIFFSIAENIENVFPSHEVPAVKLNVNDVKDRSNISKVLDPLQTSVLGLDCLSCHAVGHNMFQLMHEAPSNRKRKDIINQFARSGFYEPKAGITAFPHPQTLQFPSDRFSNQVEPLDFANFHNFGHFLGEASVSFRTVYESAEVAAAFNKIVHGNEAGPGKSCKSKFDFVRKTFQLVQNVAKNPRNEKNIITCND